MFKKKKLISYVQIIYQKISIILKNIWGKKRAAYFFQSHLCLFNQIQIQIMHAIRNNMIFFF